MIVRHVFGLLTRPREQWAGIREERLSLPRVLLHLALLAAIPVVCSYFGTTEVGWRVGVGAPIRITPESALRIGIFYYLTIIIGVYWVGWMIGWMAESYGGRQPLSQCLLLATYIPTPLFLFGFMQLYPVLWVNVVVSYPALAFTVVLLYTGVPEMMQTPKEYGFLFANSVLAVGMVFLVGVLCATVIIWSLGLAPAHWGR